MDLWTFVLTCVIGGVILYYYRTLTYFKRHGILHKTPLPIVGNMLPIFLKKFHFVEFASQYTKNWPDAKYTGFYMMSKPTILIRDIDIIKEITIKQFDKFHDHDVFTSEEIEPLFAKGLFGLKGAKWRETRAILSPAFTTIKMKQMYELINVCARNFSHYILKHADNDVEIKDAFSRYTIDVIATTAFGISVNSLEDPDNRFYILGKRALTSSLLQTVKLIVAQNLPKLGKVINLQFFDVELTEFFCGLVKNAIETRKKEGIVRPDMLQLMIDSQEKENALQMDFMDMTSQAFLFFLAGFETSSLLMAYATVEIAKNPEIQQRLAEEVDRVVEKSGGNPTYEDILSMSYLDAILYETLRLHPVNGFMDRICTEDFVLPPALPGHQPYTIKKGESIAIPSFVIHRDPLIYENPEVFDPDRFYNQKMSTNMPTFLAFGIGPRSCIGNRFALLENKLALFYLMAECNLQLSSKLKLPIVYTKDTLIPLIQGGFWVKPMHRKKKDGQ